jgi:hypothetical protein
VFASGRYVVLSLSGGETPAWIDEVVEP